MSDVLKKAHVRKAASSRRWSKGFVARRSVRAGVPFDVICFAWWVGKVHSAMEAAKEHRLAGRTAKAASQLAIARGYAALARQRYLDMLVNAGGPV